jgi:DNA repair exonuclease SbcCD ATPase subunit
MGEGTMRPIVVAFVGLSLFGIAACKEKTQWGLGSDRFVAQAGDRLDSLEKAWMQEEGRRGRLLNLASEFAPKVARLPAGDPYAIEQAEAALVQINKELSMEKAALEAELEPLQAAVKQAETVVSAKESELDAARQRDTEMAGTVAMMGGQGRCGDDGCGGSCGGCGWSEVCNELFCRCVPDCEAKECGKDGCGGVCGSGSCGGGKYCTDYGQCRPREFETVCRPDCRYVPKGKSEEARYVEDFSSRPTKKWSPSKLTSLAQLQTYLAALRERKGELDGLINGAAAIAAVIEDAKAKLEGNKAAATTLTEAVKAAKQAASQARKELKNVAPADLPPAEANVKAMEDAALAKEAELNTLKAEASTLASTIRDKEAELKKIEREMSDIKEGARRLAAEVGRIGAADKEWSSRQSAVSAAGAAVDAAKRELHKAQTALKGKEEAIEKARKALDVEYAPAFKEAQAKLTALTAAAFDEVLIGAARPTGLNVESDWVLELKEPERAGRIAKAVAALHDSRRAAWDRLSEEDREKYENWPKELDMLTGYGKILAGLELSAGRSSALDARMVEERGRLLQAMDEARTTQE